MDGKMDETLGCSVPIVHMRHPEKHGLLTLAGNEDCDIPELTASFCFGAAQIENPELSDRS
jgi:hypothetical protein